MHQCLITLKYSYLFQELFCWSVSPSDCYKTYFVPDVKHSFFTHSHLDLIKTFIECSLLLDVQQKEVENDFFALLW